MIFIHTHLLLVNKIGLKHSFPKNNDSLTLNKEGEIQVKKPQRARVENQVYSSRVARSEFDRKWRTVISKSGYIIYTATANNAKVEVLLTNGQRKLLVFNKRGRIMVGGGGTSHYSKPHLAKIL